MSIWNAYPGPGAARLARGSAKLRRLIDGAVDKGGLTHLDLATMGDLLAISGHLEDEALPAALLVLLLALDEGSLCVEISKENLESRLSDLVERSDAEEWAQRIAAALETKRFPNLIGDSVADGKPVVLRGARLYFHKYLQHEAALHASLSTRLVAADPPPRSNLPAILHDVLVQRPGRANGKSLALGHDQRLALGLALERRLTVISGGPGTGKTSLVFTLLRCLARAGTLPANIALAAPTGRAVQRLGDSVRGQLDALRKAGAATAVDESLMEIRADTLHRLLGYQPTRGTFRHHADNPVAADVVIVDEVSMVGIVLMSQLLEALGPDTRLVLLGDKDQLPSVEAGAILAQMTASPTVPCFSANMASRLAELFPEVRVAPSTAPHPLRDTIAVLGQNFRSQGLLHAAAQYVLTQRIDEVGQWPAWAPAGSECWADLECRAGCWVLEQHNHDVALWRRTLDGWAERLFLTRSGDASYQELVAAWKSVEPAKQQEHLDRLFARLDRGRILTLIREGLWGCTGINDCLERFLRQRLDPGSGSGPFAGAPVLITRNDDGRQLFNGDVGITLRSASGGYHVAFPRQGAYLMLPAEALPAHEPAFALTVHKAQGSEFDRILLVVPPEGGKRLLSRELIYTGITRARELAVVWAARDVLRAAVERRVQRESGLLRFEGSG